jgi:hypothetical protein
MQMLDNLRSFDIDRIHTDEAIALVVFAKGLRAEYETRQMDVPEWLTDKVRSLDRWIASNRRDALELRLKEARAAQAGLMTADQRREKVAADILAIEAELAKTV